MKVLVVEDDPELSASLCRGLFAAGFAADHAQDGETGEDLAMMTPYDAIVLDIMLPLKDGIAVCRSLRTKGIVVPILMLTARDSIDDRVNGLDAGADDYLVKPFAFPELLARLRALDRRQAPYRSETLSHGDIELNAATHEVKRGGVPIETTHKEYLIIEYLMRHPGMVVSRAMIEERVWDYEFSSTSNLVDVYIRRLRAKLGNGNENKFIETVRGAGYRLRTP